METQEDGFTTVESIMVTVNNKSAHLTIFLGRVGQYHCHPAPFVARTMNLEDLSQDPSTIEIHGPLLFPHYSALVRY